MERRVGGVGEGLGRGWGRAGEWVGEGLGKGWLFQEEDKRATTNVQHRFVPFFLLSFLLFCSH